MSMTAWRFRSTEGADGAVARLKQLDAQDMINVQDVAVIRWPDYAKAPVTHEHAAEEGSAMSALVSKMRHDRIDSATLNSIKKEMMPGTSAVVVMSTAAAIDAVGQAFRDQPMEMIKSDLPVPEQDRLRSIMEPGPGNGQPMS